MNKLRPILIGSILGFVLAALILIKISYMSNGQLGFDGQIIGGVNGNLGHVKDLAYNTDTTYYLSNFLNFISSTKTVFVNRTPSLENPGILSGIIALILIAGALIYLRENEFKFDKTGKIGIILCITALLSFNSTSSFITILLAFAGLWLSGRKSKNKIGIIMLSWILVYLIFFSYYDIKVNRYIIPAIPGLIYLITASIKEINNKISINKNIIPVILISLFLIQGFCFIFTFEDTNQFIAPEEISNYIITNNDDYENIEIGVYNMRHYNWYLGNNITGIESNDTNAIDKSNVTYYISNQKLNLTNYTEIKEIDDLYLYKNNVII